MTYRPWGPLDWALGITKPRRWDFVGALGTEERSLGAWQSLKEPDLLSHCLLLEVHDLQSRYTATANRLLRDREATFISLGGSSESIVRDLQVLEELHRIIAIAQKLEAATSGSMILDITSLPKRFFFPLIRYFEQSARIADFMIFYTLPDHYVETGSLSENATDWLNLPGFHGKGGKPEMLIVSVGFMVESLQSHIATINKQKTVKVIIPFPSPMAALHRTWDSIYRLESTRVQEKFEHHRVATNDLSAAFDRIDSFGRESSHNLSFAPFGPKPISAAMCLYASKHECAVYYPQPRVYNPEYSTGIGEIDGKRAVFAYWVKHNGKHLFDV